MNTDRRTWMSSTAAVLVAALTLAAGCALVSRGGVSEVASTSRQSSGPALDTAPSASAPAAAAVPAGAARNASGAAPRSVAGAVAGSPLADRMVIRTANVRIEAAKTLDAVSALRALATRYGGVVAALEIATDEGNAPQPAAGSSAEGPASGALRGVPSGLPFSGSVTVLVPVSRFDAFRSDAERIGRVLSETSGDEDVTQQHADLAARLANARAEEARLRGFFSAAHSVSEMLAIERELTRVRGDIESMAAQLKTIERQAAMATLTIEIVQPLAVVRPAGVDWGFSAAVTKGVRWLASIVEALIVLGISLVPPLGAAIALVLGYRSVARRVRARRAAVAES